MGPHCAALLGEPGSGKSIELRVLHDLELSAGRRCYFIDLREYGDESRLVEDLASIETKIEAGLTLFGDSLDEGILQVRTLADILGGWLERQNPARLRLRLACRTGAWPNSLQHTLEGRSWPDYDGKRGIFIGALQRLRREDAGDLAASRQIDPAQFLSEVELRRAEALAARPVTHRLLRRLFRREQALPSSRWDLYDRATRLLASETDRRRSQKGLSQTSANHAQQIAGLLAVTSVLSNRPVFAVHLDAEDDTALSVDGLVDRAHSSGMAPYFTTKGAHAVLESGLFDAAGSDTAGLRRWAHRSFAEFLAARDLESRKLDLPRLLELLCLPQDRAPIPQLHELIAWVVSRDGDLRDHIAGSQPEVLLRCDPSALTNGDREAMVEAILSACERKELSDSGTWTDQLSALVHPGLASQLAEWLPRTPAGRTDDLVARRVAVLVAREGQCWALTPLLGEIARDPDDVPVVRGRAAAALVHFNSDDARAEIRPLLSWGRDTDPDRELLGLALHAWARHLGQDGLFSSLPGLPDSHFFGTYYTFVLRVLPDIITENGWEAGALDWLVAIKSNRQDDDIGYCSRSCQEALLSAAWERIEGPVLDAMVRLLFDFAANFSGAPLPSERVAEDTAQRRALIEAILSDRNASPKQIGNIWWHTAPTLLQPEDFPWLVDRYLVGNIDDKERVREALLRTARIDRPDHCGLVLALAEQHEEVRSLFRSWIEPVDLDSEDVKRERRLFGHGRTRGEALDPAAIVQRAIGQGKRDVGQWWQLLHALSLQPGDDRYGDAFQGDIEDLPGWKMADQKTRQGATELARRYLEKQLVDTDAWLGQSQFPGTVLAGVRAAQLVHREGEDVSPAAWRRWAGAIIDHGEGILNSEEHQALVRRCVEASPEESSRVVLRLMDLSLKDSPRAEITVRRALLVETPEVTDGLVAVLRAGTADDDADLFLLDALAARGVIEALVIARSRLSATTAPTGKDTSAARALFRHGGPRDWEFWWPRFSTDPEFAGAVAGSLAHWALQIGGHGIERHPAVRLGQLYRRLLEVFPRSEDPNIRGSHSVGIREEIAEFRNRIPQFLAQRALNDDIQVLEELCRTDELLRWHLDDARANNRRASWSPHDLTTLLGLLTTPQSTGGRTLLPEQSEPRPQDRTSKIGQPLPTLLFVCAEDGEGRLASFQAAWAKRRIRARKPMLQVTRTSPEAWFDEGAGIKGLNGERTMVVFLATDAWSKYPRRAWEPIAGSVKPPMVVAIGEGETIPISLRDLAWVHGPSSGSKPLAGGIRDESTWSELIRIIEAQEDGMQRRDNAHF